MHSEPPFMTFIILNLREEEGKVVGKESKREGQITPF